MRLSAEERAEINRRNSRKSTGPKTSEGKTASRGNALKHGLTAQTITPVDVPGEPPGAYRARLAAWVADTQPRNVLELEMIERACWASWKLDLCARFEDATVAEREANPAADRPGRRREAEYLGNLLMFKICIDDGEGRPQDGPNVFDNAPRDADALAQFKEGVEWLLDAWASVLPNLPGDDDEPSPDGADEWFRGNRRRVLRLLGVPAPAQPLRAAGEAEVRRLRALHAAMTDLAAADLALFRAGPDARLLMRYEAQAERELHRAVDAFLKLRKDPALVPPSDADSEAVVVEAEATPPAAPGGSGTKSRRPPASNEPSPPRGPAGVATPPAGPRPTRIVSH